MVFSLCMMTAYLFDKNQSLLANMWRIRTATPEEFATQKNAQFYLKEIRSGEPTHKKIATKILFAIFATNKEILFGRREKAP